MNEITIQQGVQNLKSIKVWDTRVTPRAALDLTGRTILITVKTRDDNSSDDSGALIKSSITSHSDPTNGITIWDLSASDSNVAPGSYIGDIKILDLNLNSERFGVRVEKVVTKRTS